MKAEEKYEIEMLGRDEDTKLEFFICDTNELDPYREIKEIGIVIHGNKFGQLDGQLDVDQLKDLINYLNRCKRRIIKFNSESKPSNPCLD